MDNKEKLLKYSIYYLSKYSSSKKNLEYILKKKIRRISDEKKIRFHLYKEIKIIIDKLEQLKLINDTIIVVQSWMMSIVTVSALDIVSKTSLSTIHLELLHVRETNHQTI